MRTYTGEQLHRALAEYHALNRQAGTDASLERCVAVDDVLRVLGLPPVEADVTQPREGLTEEGQRIPPIPGEPPCDAYEAAGPGAGLEADGLPQCARCGWSKALHLAHARRADTSTLHLVARAAWRRASLEAATFRPALDAACDALVEYLLGPETPGQRYVSEGRLLEAFREVAAEEGFETDEAWADTWGPKVMARAFLPPDAPPPEEPVPPPVAHQGQVPVGGRVLYEAEGVKVYRAPDGAAAASWPLGQPEALAIAVLAHAVAELLETHNGYAADLAEAARRVQGYAEKREALTLTGREVLAALDAWAPRRVVPTFVCTGCGLKLDTEAPCESCPEAPVKRTLPDAELLAAWLEAERREARALHASLIRANTRWLRAEARLKQSPGDVLVPPPADAGVIPWEALAAVLLGGTGGSEAAVRLLADLRRRHEALQARVEALEGALGHAHARACERVAQRLEGVAKGLRLVPGSLLAVATEGYLAAARACPPQDAQE